MTDIFVSYRRDDSPWSARLINDSLEKAFGSARVFFDTVAIQPGEDFVEVIGNKVGACRALLAVIGPRWLDLLKQRSADNNDFVRIEIAQALSRGVRLVPILIDGAEPPSEAQLPDDLKALGRRNAVPIRAATYASDVGLLVDFLKRFLDASPAASSTTVAEMDVPVRDRGALFRDFKAPELLVIPAGEFTMGVHNRDDAKPVHQVTISRPFAVARYPTTYEEWDAAYSVGAVKRRPKDRGSRSRHPVIHVSWHDAKEYVAWLSTMAGRTYRLLSEAEWEYCCRAGTTTAYWTGDAIARAQAQFSEKEERDAGKTVEVGKFPANAWGLCDMHGNVWEWCEDSWHGNYQGAPADGRVWEGGDDSQRVIRGGSWANLPRRLQAGYRDRAPPGHSNNLIGFRVAQTL